MSNGFGDCIGEPVAQPRIEFFFLLLARREALYKIRQNERALPGRSGDPARPFGLVSVLRSSVCPEGNADAFRSLCSKQQFTK